MQAHACRAVLNSRCLHHCMHPCALAQKGLARNFQTTSGTPPHSILTSNRKRVKALPRADVLIVDGSNIAFSAAADRNRWRHLGATLESCFADHLRFLLAATGNPTYRYLVFDKPKRGAVVDRQRPAVFPNYLRRREKKRLERASKELTWSQWGSKLFRILLHGGQRKDMRLLEAGRSYGFINIEACGGWEADDAIATLCRLIREQPGSKQEVVLVSNDSDLQQLLSKETSILTLPAWHHSKVNSTAGLGTLTSEDFEEAHGFPPSTYPFFRALTGKRDADVTGLGLPMTTIKKLCQSIRSSEDLQAACSDGRLARWPRRVQEALGTGPRSQRRALDRNLLLMTLHTGPTTLPEGFTIAAAPNTDQAASTDAIRTPKDDIQESAMPDGGIAAATALDLKVILGPYLAEGGAGAAYPALATLIWMHPFNAGRARYLRPHVEALSTYLSAARVKHRAWAVSSKGLPIDIAILGPASSGFSPKSIFFILGEGDIEQDAGRQVLLTGGAQKDDVQGVTDSGEKSVLARLLQPPQQLAIMTGAAKVRVKALRKAGWTVLVVHHRTLQAVLRHTAPRKPFSQKK